MPVIVGTGAFKCPLDAGLQRSARDAFAVTPNKQRVSRGPLGEAGCDGNVLLLNRAWEADGAAAAVCRR